MKMDVTIAVPGLAFNGDTFDKQSLGGSETAGYYMARALAKIGHRVTVFCNSKPTRCSDVDYLPIDMYRRYLSFTPHDVTIAQRDPTLFAGHSRARLSALWCHDLAIKRTEGVVNGVGWNWDKLLVLSEFQRRQYKDVYGIPDDVFHLTRNGVDLELVGRVRERLAADPKVSRRPLSLVYSARPERGLDVLLSEIMPRILRDEPNATLFVSTYQNPVDHLADFYGHCSQLAELLGPGRVVSLGNLTKEQLYEVYLTAGLYLYPVPSPFAPDFDEISCISAMEAQACGLPIVSTARGALPETVAPGAGVLVSDEVLTPGYCDSFAAAAVRLMRDPSAWEAASKAGIERAASLDWDSVARDWSEMFEREIRARNTSPARLANHFWRRSDVYAAREALKSVPVGDVIGDLVRRRLAEDFAFIDEPEGFRKQYEKIGGTHDDRVIGWAPHEPRYQALRATLLRKVAALAADAPDIRILDYGCAHGAYATNLLKEVPRIRITGVDIDIHGIEMACKFAEQLGVADRWRGVVGDLDRLTDPNVPEMTEEYDLVLGQEVLEHVPDPAALLRALEARTADGGEVYLTVPSGPWEFTDYKRYPFRAHIREFDLHDLNDLLDFPKGPVAEVTKQFMSFGNEPLTDEPLGWWVVTYKVTAETRGKVGEIDMERKLWLQRPRETLSATIVAGGPTVEETLLWNLRSLEHVADEVIIVDCGMTDVARKMALELAPFYAGQVRIIPGVDPKIEGFETPRNIGLAAASGDWVLWIDTDEKLLQPERLHKYLRANAFQGYSLHQHHFAVDTTFPPDLPVRVFRNNGKFRFFGMIHEHPETALNEGPGRTLILRDVHIPHLGYLIESGRQRRFDRNLPMLQADIKKYPDRKLQKHFIMRDTMLLVSYELARNGQRVTPQIIAQCEEVVRIYREHFLGKGHFTNSDPLEYYSQAVGILSARNGKGFDFAFSLSADKVEAKPNGVVKARFASVNDLVVEVSRRAKDAAEPFEHRYF